MSASECLRCKELGLDREFTLNYLQQLISALKYLHQKNILYLNWTCKSSYSIKIRLIFTIQTKIVEKSTNNWRTRHYEHHSIISKVKCKIEIHLGHCCPNSPCSAFDTTTKLTIELRISLRTMFTMIVYRC